MPTLQELEDALRNASAAGDKVAASKLASAIAAQQAASLTPEESLAQSFVQAGAEYRAAANAPSAAGAFVREGARSVAPGVAGFMGGAGAGALAGTLGAGPIGTVVGAIGGGLASAMGVRMGQDALADEIAPDSFMGTKQAAADFEAQPVASLIGGALAQGRPAPVRLFNAGRNLATAEGRALLSAGLKADAPMAAQVALNDVVDVGAGAGLGAGMSLASGDGMALENAGIGALFSRGWIGGGPVMPPGGEAAPANTNTGLIASGPIRGKVTRMGNGEIEPFSPPVVMPLRPGLPNGQTAGLPAPGIAGRLPAPAPVEGLPAPIAGEPQSPPVSNADDAIRTRSVIESLEADLVNNRVRRENFLSNLKARGMDPKAKASKDALKQFDLRAAEIQSRIENLRNNEVVLPPEPAPQQIVEIDNRPLGTKPGDRLPLPAPEPAPVRRMGKPVSEPGPVIEVPAELVPAPVPAEDARLKGIESDLKLNGVAYDGDTRLAIKRSGDDTFYVERTVNGQREELAFGQPDIAAAQAAAMRIAAGVEDAPAIQNTPTPAVESVNRPGGMSVEEGKAYLEQRGKESIMGYAPDEIMRMQQGENVRRIIPRQPTTTPVVASEPPAPAPRPTATPENMQAIRREAGYKDAMPAPYEMAPGELTRYLEAGERLGMGGLSEGYVRSWQHELKGSRLKEWQAWQERKRQPSAPAAESAPAPLSAKRAKDFAETGNYEVETAEGIRRMYRDPESGWWYWDQQDGEPSIHFSERVLGFNKAEALESMAKKFGTPEAKPAPAATRTVVTSAPPAPKPQAKARNEWLTSDIKITRDPEGFFSASHKYQGDLVVSMPYPDRNAARRAAVESLNEMKENQDRGIEDRFLPSDEDAPPAKSAAAPEATTPVVGETEVLAGRARSMAIGRKKNAENQLAALQKSGKGDTPQAQKLRDSIAKLSAQIGEETPGLRARVREVIDSDEYPTVSKVIELGGFAPPPKGLNLIARNKKAGGKLSESSVEKQGKSRPWDDMPAPGHFDGKGDGGQLAKAILSGRLYNRDADAQLPDQMAAQLGMDVREFSAKLSAELDEIARNNGPRRNAQDKAMEEAESQTVEFEKAIAAVPGRLKGEAGELGKGDTFEIDGEPFRVVAKTSEAVTIRDGDRFGTQTVDVDELIPMDNLKPAESAAAPASAMDRKNQDSRELFADDGGFSLVSETTQDGEAITRAREEKAKAAAEADANQGRLFGEDTPEQSRSWADSLRQHRDKVDESIRRDAREGRNYAVIPGLDPVTAKRVYSLALSTAIKAIEAGEGIRKAIKAAVAAVKARFPKLSAEQLEAVEGNLSADAAAHVRFGKERDGQMKVEIARLSQEFAAKGMTSPTKADFIRELSARFPDQAAYVRANIDSMLDGMMFDRGEMAKDSSEWGDWARSATERIRSVLSAAKSEAPERRIGKVARSIHDTLFTGLGHKMHNLADGKLTGRRSAALKRFASEVFGLKAGEDGVQRVSIDLRAETDSARMLNPLDNMASEVDAYFRNNKIPVAERAAWKARIADHMVDPSRDGELKGQPELKKAVDFFLQRRRERLDYMRENMVDVGDAGYRSASRVMDPLKVIANRGEFIAQAAKAYRAKWNREIGKLKAEAAMLKARGKDGDAERYEKIQEKIKEISGRDAKEAAERYFYAIESGERGVSSDGNDIFGVQSGDIADSHKSREFGPEADDLLGKFMIRDAFELDAFETTAAVRAVTRARMLASKTKGGTEIDRVGKWKKLRADLEAEGNGDMVPLAAQLIKSYLNLGGSDNPVAQKLLEWTHTFTQLAYLSRAGISNLGEPVLIGLRTGRVGDIIRAYRATGRALARRLRNVSPSESQIIADALGVTKGGLNSLMGAARMQDAFGGRGRSGKLVSAFHVKTLLTDITAAMHEASVEIGRAFIHAELRLAKAGGSLSRLSRRNLTELGIGEKDIDRMLRFADSLEKAKDKKAAILANTPDAAKYRAALTLFNRSGAVLDPTRGSRAQYSNSPLGSLFYSLQSFLYEFHQKVTLRHASRLSSAISGKMKIEGKTEILSPEERTKIATEIMAGIAAIYSAQFGVQMIREYVFSDPERIAKDMRRTDAEILAQRAKAAASRTGIFGPYDLLFNMVTGARFQREPATVVLGPAVGGFSELFQGAVNYFNEDQNTAGTNTAERKLARTAYNLTVAPAIGALSATMPGRLIPGALIQGGYHPAARERFVEGLAGPPERPKGPLSRAREK